MTQVTNSKTTLKQLKKNDFLKIVGSEPLTKAQVVEALADFQFIPSYLDYLTEHFIAQKKIIRNEDGTIQSASKKAGAGAARKGYTVVEDDDGNLQMEVVDVPKGTEVPEGYALTAKRAVKNFTSVLFAYYMSQGKAARELLAQFNTTEETDAE